MKPKGGQITLANKFFVLELASVNLMLKEGTEILWHIVALTSMLFGRMRTWVNKTNWFPLYFIILMWSSCKDSFSVFCQCFHECILIAEDLCSLGPGFPSDSGGWCTSVGFLLSTFSVCPCLVSLLQVHSWKGLVVSSCSMLEDRISKQTSS